MHVLSLRRMTCASIREHNPFILLLLLLQVFGWIFTVRLEAINGMKPHACPFTPTADLCCLVHERITVYFVVVVVEGLWLDLLLLQAINNSLVEDSEACLLEVGINSDGSLHLVIWLGSPNQNLAAFYSTSTQNKSWWAFLP